MDVLPNEILEKIILEMDGLSLVSFKRTCKRFANVVRCAEKNEKFDVWRRRCRCEIAEDIFKEIAGHRTDFRNYSGQVDWENIYTKWVRQLGVTDDRPNVLKSFDMYNSKVPNQRYCSCTCMKLADDYLITGHENGSVQAWDILRELNIGIIVDHKRKIVDLVLVDYFNSEFEDCFMGYHHVLTVSADNTMKSAPMTGSASLESVFTFTHRIYVPLKQARVFGDKVALLCGNGNVELLTMKLSVPKSCLQFLSLQTLSLNFPSKPFYWMGFWNDKVIITQSDLSRYTIPISCAEEWPYPGVRNEPQLVNDMDGSSNPIKGDVVATVCHLFREKIVIMLTACRHLCVSIDGFQYRAYSTMKDLGGAVTSALVKGNLLVVGTCFGGVYVYYFEADEDLLDLKLDKPSWSGQLDDGSAILHVDIKLDDRESTLVASNRWSVMVVKWGMTIRDFQKSLLI